MLCRATQDAWVMLGNSHKIWFTGEKNGKPLQYSCLENTMNGMKRQKDRTLKDGLTRLEGPNKLLENIGENDSRKNKEKEPKQK